ncbi:hypothetical protein ACI8AF_00330 [Blastococcus sp. SYSU D00669]
MNQWTLTALNGLRGPNDPAKMTARRLAATLEAPGCARRTLLDAARVDVDQLARVLGAPPDRQSPFAITRGNRFERSLTDPTGMPDIVALTRRHLGLEIPEVRQKDLSHAAVAEEFSNVTNELRETLTRQYVAHMLAGHPGAYNLLRHPMTSLYIGGVPAWLEQDVLAFAVAGRLYVVEIKSYPCIDNRADQDKVSASARQSAVYVLSLMELAEQLGYDRSRVSTEVLLVMPENMGMTPVGHKIDVRLPVLRLRREIAAAPEVGDLLAGLPDGLTLPRLPGRKATQDELAAAATAATETISALPARFGDPCLQCPMFQICRNEAEAQGLTARLGNTTASACGDVRTVDRALALADGSASPASESEAALAAVLARGAAAAALLIPHAAGA